VLGTVAKADAIDIVERLADTTVSVYMVPDYFETHLFHGHWSNLGGIPLVSVFDTPFWGAHGWLKKVQDLTLGALILAIAAIPMALIALAVKLTSRGPVFFRQRRYGIDGKEITVMKFRTMTVTEDGANVVQAQKNDPRLTSIGGFLRKHSLDELPQFINVLRGEMSIVGPRPHAVAHNELYRRKVKGYMLRHKVKPGITGWAQINGWRGETDDLHKMEKRVEYDLWYIRNWSFWLDIKIIIPCCVVSPAQTPIEEASTPIRRKE
jgi:putative colanic acid biosynthesis UDP-glucose lipid carrier transferase